MLNINNIRTYGIEEALRGMRNPYNSHDKSDSTWHIDEKYHEEFVIIGDNDEELMRKLMLAGSEHRKYMRFMTVYFDVTAPLYWWKEFDTYKVGTVANSCSTMHTITSKEFTLEDFSCEHLEEKELEVLSALCVVLNVNREKYMKTKDKKYWWNIIQLLPSSYNQKRTIMCNYEVLRNIYHQRKEHKLDEWKEFCEMIIYYLPNEWLINE